MDIKKINIVLITSGQPSINPRLVKEADALVAAGYTVKVIYQYRTTWAVQLDFSLLANKKWDFVCVSGSPKRQSIQYLYTRIKHKIGQFLAKHFNLRNNIAELALGRCTFELAKEAKKTPAALYIAHNLGALPAAVLAAKKNNAKCGFDAEDFHRYEFSSNPKDPDVKLKQYIEDKYFPQLDYLSTASPLITKEYSAIYPSLKPITLLNVFYKQHIEVVRLNESKIRLFWFSQTVSHSRGLENIIKAMGISKINELELHLLGDCDLEIQNSFKELAVANGLSVGNIYFHPPIAPDEIFSFAAKFDIGLAAEIGEPKNRDICLTNKIFTYVQSGLAILASDTSAQKDFLIENPDLGFVYGKNSPENLTTYLEKYAQNRALLNKHQANSLFIAQHKLNWENESQKFLVVIKHILNIK